MGKSYFGSSNPNYRGGPVVKQCQWCNTTFTVVRARESTAVACSRKCNAHIQSKKSHAKKAALNAGKTKDSQRTRTNAPCAEGLYSRLGRAYKCSHLTKKGRGYCSCCTSRGKKVAMCCQICGSSYRIFQSEVKKRSTCGRGCYARLLALRQKGSLSHLWRGGLTTSDMISRGSAEYANWRRQVFARDSYTCQACGLVGGKLCADHVKPWAIYPALRFDPNNGRTLCWDCHRKTETFGSGIAKIINSEIQKKRCFQYRLI